MTPSCVGQLVSSRVEAGGRWMRVCVMHIHVVCRPCIAMNLRKFGPMPSPTWGIDVGHEGRKIQPLCSIQWESLSADEELMGRSLRPHAINSGGGDGSSTKHIAPEEGDPSVPVTGEVRRFGYGYGQL
jgi:hypothetical protein